RVRNYAQAERVRLQACELEAFELASLKAQWSSAIGARREKFLRAQRAELEGYLSRRAEERRKLEQRKSAELNAEVVQKYKNLKSGMEVVQAKERTRADRMRELGISASPLLREQAPKNRNYSSQGERPMTGNSAAGGRTTRVESSAMRRARQQQQQQD